MWHKHIPLKIWLYTLTRNKSLVCEIVNWKKDQCICMSTEYKRYCNNVIIRIRSDIVESWIFLSQQGTQFSNKKDHVQFLVSFEFCSTLMLKSFFCKIVQPHFWCMTFNLSKYIFFHHITSTCTKMGSQLFFTFFLITYTKCLFVKVRWLC